MHIYSNYRKIWQEAHKSISIFEIPTQTWHDTARIHLTNRYTNSSPIFARSDTNLSAQNTRELPKKIKKRRSDSLRSVVVCWAKLLRFPERSLCGISVTTFISNALFYYTAVSETRHYLPRMAHQYADFSGFPRNESSRLLSDIPTPILFTRACHLQRTNTYRAT